MHHDFEGDCCGMAGGSGKAREDAQTEASGAASLADLLDHIESTHHAYLHAELPRISALAEKVALVHGGKDGRLLRLREVFLALSEELLHHLMKEENILFPMIRELEAAGERPASHCGSVANPMRQMEREHIQADAALVEMRSLTGGFSAPDWACPTYRALLDALAAFERDLREHVRKENEILFPQALAREASLPRQQEAAN